MNPKNLFGVFVLFVYVSTVRCHTDPPDYCKLLNYTRSNERIIGGVETTIEKHPYQASLMFFTSHSCGATIIGEKWAITAAHCVEQGVYHMFVRSGSTTHLNGGKVHKVKQIVTHEKYNRRFYDYDIALVEVEEPFELGTSGVDKINISRDKNDPPTGHPAVVTGWGLNSSDHTGVITERLREVTLNFVDRETCEYNYYGGGCITSRMICAGVKEGGKDACSGDSGGPLVANNTLYGIVSWGRNCAWANTPRVFVKMSLFVDWIADITGI